MRHDPAFGPALIDDRVLDRLDADRVVVHIQRARSFTGCRADATSELRKVVGAVQDGESVFPVALKHQFIEVGNDVVDRASAVSKRGPAIHAACTLHPGPFIVERNDEFPVMPHAFGHRPVVFLLPRVFHESCHFSQGSVLVIALAAVR